MYKFRSQRYAFFYKLSKFRKFVKFGRIDCFISSANGKNYPPKKQPDRTPSRMRSGIAATVLCGFGIVIVFFWCRHYRTRMRLLWLWHFQCRL